MGFVEKPKTIIQEDIVLNKFDGPEADGIILETVYLRNGVIIKHDYFDKNGLPMTGQEV